MEGGNSETSVPAKSCLRKPITLLAISFVVVLVIVIVAEYFIVKAAIDTTTTTTSTTSETVDIYKIPDSWLIASATSAYQVEGAWNVSDKGESIWDYYTHTYPNRTNEATGDDACKSYELYKRDVQMLVETGFNAYRFSISWPRVLPNGTADYVSTDGIAYYNNLINELLAYNITPLVTLYHWDLPLVLQDEYNGWLNASIADLFADYADVCFKNFGDRVKYWITFNEPTLIIQGYTGTAFAPGYQGSSGTTDYIVNHNLIRSHGRAYQVYNNTYRATQNGSIGMTYNINGIFPANESSWEDREAAVRSWEFSAGLYANPIYSPDGNYPSIVRERVDNISYYEGLNYSRLPHFTDEELETIRGSYDFFGVNHYGSGYVTAGSSGDSGVSNTGSTSSGEGLRNVINWATKMYDNVPVFITENGCQSTLGLNDTDRITLYHHWKSKLISTSQNPTLAPVGWMQFNVVPRTIKESMIKGVLEAYYEDGCNVIGYTAWSLMDNMEWSSGYTPKYGLWQVDFDDVNRTRTMKQSAYWFQELLSTMRLPNTTNY